MDKTIRLHPADNVAVVLRNEEGTLSAPPGHKIALMSIAAGETVYKYGCPIGRATRTVESGAWVHTHNLTSALAGTPSFTYHPTSGNPPVLWEAPPNAVFRGYRRPNGQAGIRNEIWIINTVGCCNQIAENLARQGRDMCGTYNVEGPYAFAHPYGCSQLGEDLYRTQNILANLVNHPNAAGVLVLGLGCENNHLTAFREVLGEWDPQRVKFINAQDVEDEIETGLTLLEELASFAAGFTREPIPLSELVVGMKCGGSDAFSGITANPLLGHLADILTDAEASVILTEIPEMFGAEEHLLARSDNEKVFQQLAGIIHDFKAYYRGHHCPIYENPSPGNKEGGITTLEEKSLGCILKGGGTRVMDVVPYGGRVSRKGLTILDGPGNDLVSVTNLAAAGAHLIFFSTGRGTPYGGPVPTVKVATNSALFRKKKHWLDFDTGELLEGADMARMAQEIYRLLISVSSGEKHTANEEMGFREIAVFKSGVTL